MKLLNSASPRYIRCVRPNSNKSGKDFDSVDVLRQLRCAGMLESTRIRAAGYSVRRGLREFITKYKILVPELTRNVN